MGKQKMKPQGSARVSGYFLRFLGGKFLCMSSERKKLPPCVVEPCYGSAYVPDCTGAIPLSTMYLGTCSGLN